MNMGRCPRLKIEVNHATSEILTSPDRETAALWPLLEVLVSGRIRDVLKIYENVSTVRGMGNESPVRVYPALTKKKCYRYVPVAL